MWHGDEGLTAMDGHPCPNLLERPPRPWTVVVPREEMVVPVVHAEDLPAVTGRGLHGLGDQRARSGPRASTRSDVGNQSVWLTARARTRPMVHEFSNGRTDMASGLAKRTLIEQPNWLVPVAIYGLWAGTVVVGTLSELPFARFGVLPDSWGQ